MSDEWTDTVGLDASPGPRTNQSYEKKMLACLEWNSVRLSVHSR